MSALAFAAALLTSSGEAPPAFAERWARVERALLRAAPSRSLEERLDELAWRRRLDRLALVRAPPAVGAASALGPALFGAVAALVARAPVRAPFDRPLHIGPALLDGGVGVAFGGPFALLDGR